MWNGGELPFSTSTSGHPHAKEQVSGEQKGYLPQLVVPSAADAFADGARHVQATHDLERAKRTGHAKNKLTYIISNISFEIIWIICDIK